MKARLYAEALKTMYAKHAVEGKEGALIQSLMDLLAKRGHKKLLPGILRELKKSSHRTMRKGDLVLAVASKGHEKKYEKEVQDLARKAGQDSWTTVEDPTLIGGFTLGTAHVFIDKSYKKQLNDLFKKLV